MSRRGRPTRRFISTVVFLLVVPRARVDVIARIASIALARPASRDERTHAPHSDARHKSFIHSFLHSTPMRAVLARFVTRETARPIARSVERASVETRTRARSERAERETHSARRRFTDADCVAFAALTGDANPIHLDETSAGEGGRLGGRAVHGMLAASGFGALLARVKPGTVYASQELKFRQPIRVDEEVEIEIALVKRSGRRVRYETVVRKVACGTVCVDGFALALLPE